MGRLFVCGGLFQVMGRGLERRKPFNSDEDKARLLLRLDVGQKKSGHACYAWALMDVIIYCYARVSESCVRLWGLCWAGMHCALIEAMDAVVIYTKGGIVLFSAKSKAISWKYCATFI